MSTSPKERYDVRLTRPMLSALFCLLILTLTGLWALDGFGPLSFTPNKEPKTLALQLNPNTASLPELQCLPGLGPVRAQALLAYRQAHGPNAFTSPEDLRAIRGIGPGAVEKMTPYLRFDISEGSDE